MPICAPNSIVTIVWPRTDMRPWFGVALLIGAIPILTTKAAAAPDLSADLATEERRHGLGWSQGRASIRTSLGVPVGPSLRFDASATALRDSRRHGGADAVVDLSGSWSESLGTVQVDASLIGHLFTGARGRQDYAEAQIGARTLIGPADFDLSASYAPSQHAIGGDHLYVAARSRLAVIGTPFTLSAALGHSSGDVKDPVRAARLRPGGAYTDWQLGADYVRNRFTLGLFYIGTDIAAADCAAGHCGDTVIGRLGVRF